MISNLKIVKEVLECELPEYHFSFFRVFKLSRKENLKKHYIGYRIKNFHKPGIVEDKDGNIVSGIYPKGDLTLFRYEQKDDEYYDILDSNNVYQPVSDNLLYGKYVCCKMVSLDEKVKKIRWKEGI